MKDFIIITFNSTNFAMQAESTLKSLQIKNQIIPTPREITLSCGIAIKISLEDLDQVKNLIGEGKINIKNIYKASGAGTNRVIEEIGS